jgi:four helix bundle protein
MQDFKKLLVWQRSHELTLRIYEVTASYPRDEVFGLTSQTKRAASSIPANIAEGCGRGGGADFARFLQIAQGSASELQYHLLLAHDLGFIAETRYREVERQAEEIKRMLTALIQRVRPNTYRISDSEAIIYELTSEGFETEN